MSRKASANITALTLKADSLSKTINMKFLTNAGQVALAILIFGFLAAIFAAYLFL